MPSNLRPKWQHAQTPERLDFIRQHLNKSDTEIARMMGVHRSAVHQLRQRYKIAKVHSFVQHTQGMIKKARGLKPGLPLKGAAQQLGVSENMARKYGKLVDYDFLTAPAARHFYWRKRFKSLPPLLTVTAVARELGVTYNHAAILCNRHKYKAKLRTGRNRMRVPTRNYKLRPEHERWLASLKPVKS